MDPISLIISAIVLGATAGLTATAETAIKDAYSGLKTALIQKFGPKADVANALTQLENKPASTNRQGMLKEELANTDAAQDQAILAQAKALLDLLKAQGHPTAATYNAILTGDGAIAQGGATAAGKGGMAISGSVTNSSLATGPNAHQIQTDHYIAHQVNTSGGAAVDGDVNTAGGDFIGRDRTTKPV